MSGYGRGLGWALASAAALGLLSGAAALALTATQAADPVPLVLDLSLQPAMAPSIAALADPAPQVVDEAPDLPAEHKMAEAAPDFAAEDVAPPLTEAPAPLETLVKETPVAADLALPPPPKMPVETKAEPSRPVEKPVKPKPKSEKAAADKLAKVKEPPREDKKAAAAGATAPKTAAKAAGGSKVSAKTYAKAVMKKVRATKKRSGAGQGLVVVGFSVAANGGLGSVKVLQGSGNPALDEVALDHIRRSAPFPAPPEGAGRNFSFEFVGK